MRTLVIEEINRIKSLFGENLIYGNINNKDYLLENWVKKLIDDFFTAGKKFDNTVDDIKLNKFKNYQVNSFKELSDFFNDTDIYSILKQIVGDDLAMNLKLTQTMAKKVDDDPNFISTIFGKDSTGNYYFQKIPNEGGLRAQFMYLLQQKYPTNFKKALDSLEPEAKISAQKSVDSGKIEVPTTNYPIVRVDSEGRVLDFNSSGKPVDSNGNVVPYDPTTGKPSGNFEPKIDDGGGVKFDFGDDDFSNTPENNRRALGNMSDVNFADGNTAARTEFTKSWFRRRLEDVMVRIFEGYDAFFKTFNTDEIIDKFNALLSQELKNIINNSASSAGAETRVASKQRIKESINDLFIDYYKSISNDPKLSKFNIDKIWNDMVDEVINTSAGLLPEERVKLKAYLNELKTSTQGGNIKINLADESSSGIFIGGKPTPQEYANRIKISEQDFGEGLINSVLDYVRGSLWDVIKVKNKLLSGILKTLTTIIRPAIRLFFTGSILTPRMIRQFLATESKFLGVKLRPFSKGKYVALISRGIVMNKIIFPLLSTLYYTVEELFKKAINIETGADVSDRGANEGFFKIFTENLIAEFKEEFPLFDDDTTIIGNIVQYFPGYLDDLIVYIADIGKKSAEGDVDKPLDDIVEKDKKKICDKAAEYGIPCEDAENLEKILQKRVEAQNNVETLKSGLHVWTTREEINRPDLEETAKKVESLLKANTSNDYKDVNAYFELGGKKYFLQRRGKIQPQIYSEKNEIKLDLIDFLNTYKSSIEKQTVKESLYYKNYNLIMENTPRTKFGEDNFKHWKDTFVFKAEDEKNPGQFKQVKINMEDVMDRINHYRKKYDEDDAFVRAVLDTHDNVVKVMYTKDLADISESALPRGLALVLREDRGELEIFSVSRPANGNWFLVKGDYTPSQLANMDLEKKEPEDKESTKMSKTEDDLKKKEEESIILLKRNEKEGLIDLPRKVKQKLKEKISKGWTTEEPPSYLMDFYTTSQINSVFNDPIEIYKLESSPSYFATLVKYSARVTPKRGFCRSLHMASRGEELNERQRKTINHILTRCKSKLAGKFGIASF